MLDTVRTGGIQGITKIAGTAEAYHVPRSLHVVLAGPPWQE
jgi:L-alanine-DL-glutamate epimerase-like enolase superfamily enzyme